MNDCSVLPFLQLLNNSPLKIPFIYKNASTEEELCFYLKKWKRTKFPILYLAFHGEPGYICLKQSNGRKRKVHIKKIFNEISAPKNGHIHFSCCQVLGIAPNVIQKYRNNLNLSAISGYNKQVVWTDSLVFETWLFSFLERNKDFEKAQSLSKIFENLFEDSLGFRVYY